MSDLIQCYVVLCCVLIVYFEAAVAVWMQCEVGGLWRTSQEFIWEVKWSEEVKDQSSMSIRLAVKKHRNLLVLPTSTQYLFWTFNKLLLFVSKVKSGLKMVWHKGVRFHTRTTFMILVCWILTLNSLNKMNKGLWGFDRVKNPRHTRSH